MSGTSEASQHFIITNSSSLMCLMAHIVSEFLLTGALSPCLILHVTSRVHLMKTLTQPSAKSTQLRTCGHCEAIIESKPSSRSESFCTSP